MLKKITLCALSAAMICSLGACSKKDPQEEIAAFETFINKEFQESMQNDYLTMHSYFTKPKDIGIDETKAKPEFQITTDKDTDKIKETLKEKKKALKEFDYDLLSKKQQEVYTSYKYNLELQEDALDKDYRYMEQLFTTNNGIHISMQRNLERLRVENENDVKLLISLVRSTKSCMEETISYTKQQIEENTLILDKEGVLSVCDNILENNTFYKTLENKVKAVHLDAKKEKEYLKQLQDAYEKELIPAYTSLKTFVNGIKDEDNHITGYDTIKKGDDYYEYLFKKNTQDDRSIKDSIELLDSIISDAKDAELLLASKDYDVYADWLDNKIYTEYKTYEDVAKALEKYTLENYPGIELRPYKIIPATDLKNDLISSEILPFSVDSEDPIQVLIRSELGTNSPNSLNAYSIIAQTIAPGTLYQTLYNNQTNPSLWMNYCADNSSFRNGYSIYAAENAINHLQHEEKRAIQLQRKSLPLQSALLARADIGIHYEGWTYEDFKKNITSLNLDSETTEKLYKAICTNPGNFLSAGIGYMEIYELHKEAKDTMNDKYDDKKFIETLLKSGNAPFSVIQENIEDYIKSPEK